jgi:hypothetical protein
VSGAVVGEVVSITGTSLVGGINASARISAETAGAITGIEVTAPGFGVPDDAAVAAPRVVGSALTPVLGEVQAIRLDTPASQAMSLTIVYDRAVTRMEHESDEAPIDPELLVLFAAAMVADTNGWPGGPKILNLAQRRLRKQRAATSPGLKGSMTPPDGSNRPLGTRNGHCAGNSRGSFPFGRGGSFSFGRSGSGYDTAQKPDLPEPAPHAQMFVTEDAHYVLPDSRSVALRDGDNIFHLSLPSGQVYLIVTVVKVVWSIDDITTGEGDDAVFTVTRTDGGRSVIATYATRDDNALAGTDYTQSNGSFVIGGNDTEQVSVPTLLVQNNQGERDFLLDVSL